MKNYMKLAYREIFQPNLSGRPVREQTIDTDDIINLKIALETTHDSAEILSDRFLFH